MPYTPKGRLETAEKFLKVALDLVGGQRKIVEGLQSIGRPTKSAEKLLLEFELSLEQAIQHKEAAAKLAGMPPSSD